jgi:hypothetical protein
VIICEITVCSLLLVRFQQAAIVYSGSYSLAANLLSMVEHEKLIDKKSI